MDTILLDNLSKTYPGGKQALTGISLSLGEREVFGFLGPNGAGKTTTVKLLTGILSPTRGRCQVMGTDPSREPEKTPGHGNRSFQGAGKDPCKNRSGH